MSYEQQYVAYQNYALSRGVTMLNKQIQQLQKELFGSQQQLYQQTQRMQDYEGRIAELTSYLSGKDLELKDLSEQHLVAESYMRNSAQAESECYQLRIRVGQLEAYNAALEYKCVYQQTLCLEQYKQMLAINSIGKADLYLLEYNYAGAADAEAKSEMQRLKSKNAALKQQINKQQAEIIYLRYSLKLQVSQYTGQLQTMQLYCEAMKAYVKPDVHYQSDAGKQSEEDHILEIYRLRTENINICAKNETLQLQLGQEYEKSNYLAKYLRDANEYQKGHAEQFVYTLEQIERENADIKSYLNMRDEENAATKNQLTQMQIVNQYLENYVNALYQQNNTKQGKLIELEQQVGSLKGRLSIYQNYEQQLNAHSNVYEGKDAEREFASQNEAVVYQCKMEINRLTADQMIFESYISQLQMRLEKKVQEVDELTANLDNANSIIDEKTKLITHLSAQLHEGDGKDQNDQLVIEMSKQLEDLDYYLKNNRVQTSYQVAAAKAETHDLNVYLGEKLREINNLKSSVQTDLYYVYKLMQSKNELIKKLIGQLLMVNNDPSQRLTSRELEELNKIYVDAMKQ